jgi:hypothetical protein
LQELYDLLLTLDGRKTFEKVINTVAGRQIVDERLYGNARPGENGSSAHHFLRRRYHRSLHINSLRYDTKNMKINRPTARHGQIPLLPEEEWQPRLPIATDEVVGDHRQIMHWYVMMTDYVLRNL